MEGSIGLNTFFELKGVIDREGARGDGGYGRASIIMVPMAGVLLAKSILSRFMRRRDL